jgi:hypothetical protein
MHDWLFAFAFVAMVAAPAMVAAIGGRKEYNPDPETGSALPVRSDKPFESPRSLPPALPKTFVVKKPIVTTEIRTLPVHHARGLANR